MNLPPDEAAILANAAEVVQRNLDSRGWSLRELSRRSGVSPMLLSDFLTGKSALTLTTAVQISKALEISIDELCTISPSNCPDGLE